MRVEKTNPGGQFSPSMSMSSLMGTRISVWAEFSWTAGGSVSSKQSGKVLTFLWMTLFLLMGVA